jgi:hypothetical protein
MLPVSRRSLNPPPTPLADPLPRSRFFFYRRPLRFAATRAPTPPCPATTPRTVSSSAHGHLISIASEASEAGTGGDDGRKGVVPSGRGRGGARHGPTHKELDSGAQAMLAQGGSAVLFIQDKGLISPLSAPNLPVKYGQPHIGVGRWSRQCRKFTGRWCLRFLLNQLEN